MPSAPARRGSIDRLGAILVTGGLATAEYAVARAPKPAGGSAETLLVLTGGVALVMPPRSRRIWRSHVLSPLDLIAGQ